MGRSADQTFYADSYSKFGYGFGMSCATRRSRLARHFHTYLFQVTEKDLVKDPRPGRSSAAASPQPTTTSTGTPSRCCPERSGPP